MKSLSFPFASALLVFIIVSPALQNDFVHDDIPAIVRNPDVQGRTGFIALFKNDFWGKAMSEKTSHKSYRPLTVFTYRLNRILTGGHAFFFHLTNILIHSGLVYRLHSALLRFGYSQSSAQFAAILFGIHPINSESFANNVGRAEVLSAHFMLSAITNRENTAASGMYALLAMLCKEGGVFCLAILVALEIIIIFNRRRRGEVILDPDLILYFVYKLLFWFSFLLIFVSLRLWVLNGTYPVFTPPDNPAGFAKDKFVKWASFAFYWVQHYWLLLAPTNLAYDWAYGSIPLLKDLSDTRILAIICLFASVAFIGINCLKSIFGSTNKQRILLPTLLLFIPFIPASNVLVTVGFAVAERVMYTPSIGFAILVADGLVKFSSMLESSRLPSKILNFGIVASFVLLVVKTEFRISAWQTKENLFHSGLTVHRHNAKMFYNYGNCLRNQQKIEDAIIFYEEAIRLHPTYSKAFDNIGVLYDDGSEQGSKMAEKMYQKSIEANPHHPSAYSNLASLYAQKERLQEAVKVLLSVQNYDNPYYTATLKLAMIMKRRGFDRDAEQLYQHILLLFKNAESPIAEPYNHYGALLTEQKRYEEAIKVYEQAIALEPLNPNPLVNLAWVKQTLGISSGSSKMVLDAEELYEKSLAIKPTSEAFMRLGSLKYQRGETAEAKLEYEEARKLDPENHLIVLEQSIVLVSAGETERAIEILQIAVEKDKACKLANLHITLAKIYGPRKHQFMKAASVLENCHRKIGENKHEDEDAAEIKFQLGAMYHEIVRNNQNVANPTKNEEAFLAKAKQKTLELLQEAIKLKPGDVEYRVLLAQVHLRSGNLKDGTHVLKTILKLKPDHEVATILLNRVKEAESKTS